MHTNIQDRTRYAQRCNSNMAALPFVGTLDSDDDVDQLDNETDSEDESEKVRYHSWDAAFFWTCCLEICLYS